MKSRAHLVGWVLLVAAAFLLWPASLGGRMTYVVTTGTSMEPLFSAGDLAVLRAGDDYRPGDVVAYESAELDRLVLHRIVERRADGLVFQGDNNDFVDGEVLPDSQVRGELLLRVPGVGPAVSWLLEPVHLLVAALGLWLVFGERQPRRSATAVLRVPVRGMAVPSGAVVAEVEDAADLDRLAASHGRPVLVDTGSGWSSVYDGTVLHRRRTADVAVVPQPRRPAGDWSLQPEPVSPR